MPSKKRFHRTDRRLLALSAISAAAAVAACSGAQPYCPQSILGSQAPICSQPAPERPVEWTPHTQPFDVVWDKNKEDANGLPLNPRWAAELEGKKPSAAAAKACVASARPRDDTGESCRPPCTSQEVKRDLIFRKNAAKEPFVLPGECQASADLPGHLNWTIATFTGRVSWGEYAWSDGDYNLDLATEGGAGVVGGAHALLLEFNDTETADRWGTSWWRKVKADIDAKIDAFRLYRRYDGGAPSGLARVDGYKAVATGLLGLDGVHEAQAELHPVFALAIRTACERADDTSVIETWSFFLRNEGNQGDCSSHKHFWNKPAKDQPAGPYYLQLPWPKRAACMSVVDGQWAPWDKGTIDASVEVSYDWTLIRAVFPDKHAGLDGEIKLRYAGAPGAAPSCDDAPAPTEAAATARTPTEFELRFPNPADRAQVAAKMCALSRPAPAEGCREHPETFSVRPEARRAPPPGAASRGQMVQSATEERTEEEESDLQKKREEVMKSLPPKPAASAPPAPAAP